MSDDLERMRRALAALERAEARLGEAARRQSEPVAIVGLGCRFPGGGHDVASFGDFLERGGDAIGEIPGDRRAAFDGAGHARLLWGGFLPEIDRFDPRLFGVTDEEARAMDPQLRLLLDVSWEALGDAGLSGRGGGQGGGLDSGLDGGVFLGIGSQSSDYAHVQLSDPGRARMEAVTGTLHSLMAGRLSYFLDWKGPSLALDAACASGLAAVHLACASLRERECSVAIAGAVNLVLSPGISLALLRGGLFSPSRRCRPFDARADGFVRSDGCGVVVLRRLSDALASGERILAVVRGSALRQDGRSNGLTAPSGPAQELVLRLALERAGVHPAEVDFVEAHGTGTPLGDAIEAQALGAVYGVGRAKPFLIGAVKANLGHAEAAAGMAGLVKVIASLSRRAIPPHPDLESVHPEVDLAAIGASIPTRPVPWEGGGRGRIAGVSAFGMSGTNAHLIVEEAPPGAPSRPPSRPAARRAEAAGLSRFPLDLGAAAPGPLPEDLFFTPEWEVRPSAGGKLPAGEWLLVGDAASCRELEQNLSRDLPSPEASCRVIPVALRGATGPGPGEGSGLDPFDAAGLAGAVRGLLDRRSSANVVYLRGPGRGRAASAPSSSIAADVREGCASLLHLAQALASLARPCRLWVVTRGAASGEAAQAPLAALAFAIALEHPELSCRSIDIDLDPDEPDPAGTLLAELESGDGEGEVRLGAGRRVPRLSPAVPGPRIAAPLDGEGAYLVTGAFGGIGSAVSRGLVSAGARNLVLVSRRPRADGLVEELTGAGARVRVVTADVGSAFDVARLLSEVETLRVPLRGILHAAGSVADGLLAKQTFEKFARVLPPKVEGAWNLHEATKGLPLDFFVLFSSLTTVVGLLGAGNYMAANAFLDALSVHRRSLGLPALSVDWGTWAGAGMASGGDRREEQWSRHGIGSFPVRHGVEALLRLLSHPGPRVVVANADWVRLARTARPAGRDRIAERLTGAAGAAAGTAPPAGKAPPPPGCEDGDSMEGSLIDGVLDAARRAMGLPPSAPLDTVRPLGEQGLDSIGAVELRNILSARLSRPLPATLAFNHPTVVALARFLAGEGPDRDPSGAPSERESRARVGELERLSEAEAEALLAKKLEGLGRRP